MYPSPQLGPHVLAGGLAIVLSFVTLAIAPAAMVLAPYHHPSVASPSWPQEGRATAAARCGAFAGALAFEAQQRRHRMHAQREAQQPQHAHAHHGHHGHHHYGSGGGSKVRTMARSR